MNNEKLLKISLIASLIGIFLLLLLSNIQEPKLTKIENINEQKINQKIKVQGEIINIKNYNAFQILTIQDKTGKVLVLINKNTNIHLAVNQTITIIGRLTEYKNELQIQADKIF